MTAAPTTRERAEALVASEAAKREAARVAAVKADRHLETAESLLREARKFLSFGGVGNGTASDLIKLVHGSLNDAAKHLPVIPRIL